MRPEDSRAASDDALASLVAEVLERIEREGARALDEACVAHPAHATSLRQRVLTLRELGLIRTAVDELDVTELGRGAAAHELRPGHPDSMAWLAAELSTRAKVLLATGRTADAAEALAEAPRLAGQWTARAVAALERLAHCVERAHGEGDEETVRRCDAAARTAIELARARGDLGADPAVARLVGLVGD
jgi:hypothetical protein